MVFSVWFVSRFQQLYRSFLPYVSLRSVPFRLCTFTMEVEIVGRPNYKLLHGFWHTHDQIHLSHFMLLEFCLHCNIYNTRS